MPATPILSFNQAALAETDSAPLVWCAEWEGRWTAELTAQLDGRPVPELGSDAPQMLAALWVSCLLTCLSLGLSVGWMVS